MNYLALNLSSAVPIYDISVSPFLRSVVIFLNTLKDNLCDQLSVGLAFQLLHNHYFSSLRKQPTGYDATIDFCAK